MKVFTTPQFNQAVKKLSSNDRKVVYRLFSMASHLTMEQLLPTPYLKVLIDTDDKRIYELRQRFIRIYCTIEKIQGDDSMIFIGVEKKTSNRSKFLSNILHTKNKNG
jgi:mRNA-degrading endonuclease RelE of RelBE toxin-antitoxin system